jgi:hypothetical protein
MLLQRLVHIWSIYFIHNIRTCLLVLVLHVLCAHCVDYYVIIYMGPIYIYTSTTVYYYILYIYYLFIYLFIYTACRQKINKLYNVLLWGGSTQSERGAFGPCTGSGGISIVRSSPSPKLMFLFCLSVKLMFVFLFALSAVF